MPIIEQGLVYLLSQQLCNEILSQMIENWMKIYLVNENIYNIVNYYTGVLQLVFSKTNRFDDTKYNFWCNVVRVSGFNAGIIMGTLWVYLC